jgi:hypothetical protein
MRIGILPLEDVDPIGNLGITRCMDFNYCKCISMVSKFPERIRSLPSRPTPAGVIARG